jgi:hypothetical protein
VQAKLRAEHQLNEVRAEKDALIQEITREKDAAIESLQEQLRSATKVAALQLPPSRIANYLDISASSDDRPASGHSFDVEEGHTSYVLGLCVHPVLALLIFQPLLVVQFVTEGKREEMLMIMTMIMIMTVHSFMTIDVNSFFQHK